MKSKKWVILGGVFITPLFFYFFLQFFGKNHYKLSRFYPKVNPNSGKILQKKIKAGLFSPKIDTVFQSVYDLPSFELMNQSGVSINSHQFKGKITVANFFFTRCGSICPKMTQQIARVQQAFLKNSDLKLLSYSVDTEYDTPEALLEYAKKNEADLKQWNFLTGSKKQIYQLAIKGYKIPVSDASEYDRTILNPDEAFIHSEKVILVDKEGIIRGYYDGTDRVEMDRLILEIHVLMEIYEDYDFL